MRCSTKTGARNQEVILTEFVPRKNRFILRHRHQSVPSRLQFLGKNGEEKLSQILRLLKQLNLGQINNNCDKYQ